MIFTRLRFYVQSVIVVVVVKASYPPLHVASSIHTSSEYHHHRLANYHHRRPTIDGAMQSGKQHIIRFSLHRMGGLHSE